MMYIECMRRRGAAGGNEMTYADLLKENKELKEYIEKLESSHDAMFNNFMRMFETANNLIDEKIERMNKND